MDYILLTGSREELNKQVTELLLKGYQLVGIPFYSHIDKGSGWSTVKYAQAVAKLTND